MNSTEVIGRSGSTVFVEIDDYQFFRTCDVSELWKLRRDLRDAKHVPANIRLRTFRGLERIEAEIEDNPLPVDDFEDGALAGIGLLLVAGCCAGVAFLIWWLLWCV